MITLHHYYLCSSSRYIRLILEEHNITYETQLENFWKPQKDFLKINPAGHLPVLVNEDNFPIDDGNAEQMVLTPENFRQAIQQTGDTYNVNVGPRTTTILEIKEALEVQLATE